MTHTNLLQQIHHKPFTIAIWGYGAEGRATHRYCIGLAPEHNIIILDDNPIDTAQLDGPATILTGEQGQQTLLTHTPDLLVRSPGITRYHPLLKTLAANGTELTTSTNIWFHDNPTARTLVITGSKGKSTTASLIHHTLRQLGFDSRLLGNFGTPLIGQPPGDDYTVLELSSYQTSDLMIAPLCVTLTNLFEEHLEWHGTVARYHNDKWRIADLTPAPMLIINSDDPLSCQRFSARSNTHYFSHNDIKVVPGSDQTDELVWRNRVAIRHFRARGRHNYGNLCAALTTIDQAIGGINAQHISYDTLPVLPHRLTEHRLSGGVLCVDDSISTIPQAVQAAVSVYGEQPMHLFLGGYDRGVDFSSLTTLLSSTDSKPAGLKQVVLFGALGNRLSQEFAGISIPLTVQPSLVAAIEASFQAVSKNDVLLLSPGGASYDEFKGFAERGDLFVATCRKEAEARF